MQKNIFNLKTTTSLFPFGYKVNGSVTKELRAEEKIELWRTVLAFADQYTSSPQHDICGYQNAPEKGTLLECSWNTEPHVISASVHTTMTASSTETLTFQGKWSFINIQSVHELSVPDNLFFGVELYKPRSRFLFGVIPTMIEQFTVTVVGPHLLISVFGRALQNPILSALPLLAPYQKLTMMLSS